MNCQRERVCIVCHSLSEEENGNYNNFTGMHKNHAFIILVQIAFEVDCNDGFSGSASSPWLTKWSKVGFYRDYRHNQESSFGTGKIK